MTTTSMPVGRVVQLAEIRHAALDHRLLVVGGDDHGHRRQRVLVGEHRPRAHASKRPRSQRVRGVRPHERARRSPEEDLCDRHRRSASLRPRPLHTASLSHAEPGLLRRGRTPELHEGGSGAARAARVSTPESDPIARPYRAALRRRDVRRLPAPTRPADAGCLPRCRLGHVTASRPRGRSSAWSRSDRARAGARRRLRRRQLDAGRRARGGEAPTSRSRIIEAGLRSFDPTMPEEHNRRLTDHLSAVLLAHSQSAVENLAAEGIAGASVHLVGNTMIDSLLEHVETARAARPWEAFGLDAGRLRARDAAPAGARRRPGAARARPSTALVELAATVPLVFPVAPAHRRAARRGGSRRRGCERSDVRPAPPLGYLEFLGLEAGGAARAHRLRRRAGGDVGARRPVLHAARHDGAAGHGRARDEHRCSVSSRSASPTFRRCSRLHVPRSRSRSGTDTPASARPT